MKKAIAYYRVSTRKQVTNGYSLIAQKKLVHGYAKTHHIQFDYEFVEIAGGTKKDRPILTEALLYCQENKIPIIVSTLDRLSRKVSFISLLMDSGIKFIIATHPNITKFETHILAAHYEQELDLLSERTKSGLSFAREQGVKLGTSAQKLAMKNKTSANQFARKIKPIIDKIKKENFTSVRSITEQLNKRNVSTFHGKGCWHPTTVHNILKRLKDNF